MVPVARLEVICCWANIGFRFPCVRACDRRLVNDSLLEAFFIQWTCVSFPAIAQFATVCDVSVLSGR